MPHESARRDALVFDVANARPAARSRMTQFHRQPCTTLALCALLGGTLYATFGAAEPLKIDVITTASRHVRVGSLANDPALQITVAEVDSIARFEKTLSAQLPADPERAQREVLRRLAALQKASAPSLQGAAMGLALASELGIDRTPAIVFDRAAVIYGEVDLEDALRRYRAWALESR